MRENLWKVYKNKPERLHKVEATMTVSFDLFVMATDDGDAEWKVLEMDTYDLFCLASKAPGVELVTEEVYSKGEVEE